MKHNKAGRPGWRIREKLRETLLSLSSWKCPVNYPMNKFRGLSPTHQRWSANVETCGLLTEARRLMLIAAMWSARPENPQTTHLKQD